MNELDFPESGHFYGSIHCMLKTDHLHSFCSKKRDPVKMALPKHFAPPAILSTPTLHWHRYISHTCGDGPSPYTLSPCTKGNANRLLCILHNTVFPVKRRDTSRRLAMPGFVTNSHEEWPEHGWRSGPKWTSSSQNGPKWSKMFHCGFGIRSF